VVFSANPSQASVRVFLTGARTIDPDAEAHQIVKQVGWLNATCTITTGDTRGIAPCDGTFSFKGGQPWRWRGQLRKRDHSRTQRPRLLALDSTLRRWSPATCQLVSVLFEGGCAVKCGWWGGVVWLCWGWWLSLVAG